MPVLFKHSCPLCGQDTYGEVHRECAEANLRDLTDPKVMTAEDRYREVMAYQNYPAGWPLDLLQTRIEALIGRKLRVSVAPADWSDSIQLSRWLTNNETLPGWRNNSGWERLAQEAKTAYRMIGS